MPISSIEREQHWRRTETRTFSFRPHIWMHHLRPISGHTDLHKHRILKCGFFITIQQLISFELIFQREDQLHHSKHSAPNNSPTQGHNFSVFSSALFPLPLPESPSRHITSTFILIVEFLVFISFSNIFPCDRKELAMTVLVWIWPRLKAVYARNKNRSANKEYFFFVFFITLCATSNI